MSKRAEEMALKVFPVLFSERNGLDYTFQDRRNAFEKGYEQAEKDTIERAIKWLIDRMDISYSVATNENGEPLADSYIDYAKKRLEAANEIVDDFRKAMEDE